MSEISNLISQNFNLDFIMNSNSNSSKKGGSNTTIITKVPCKLCCKTVSYNDNALLCDLCQT